ncbi:MAG TPA: hypothetical protein VGH45_08145 [Solirubrobacteraceae bacterium]|jgi:hypothetical protein
MPSHRTQPSQGTHDVLAAEEFGVPAPDPALHQELEEAHDVLAAEEFGVPARDPSLHHGPVSLPSDPTGIAEPHDVLAAEEFAMPAPPLPGGEPRELGRGGRVPRGAVVALGAAVVIALRRRRRRFT